MEFDLAEVVRWREERVRAALESQADAKDIDLDRLRCRRARAEAELAELEFERARSALVEVETVTELVEADYDNVRACVRALPSKLAPQIARLDSPAEVERLLDRAIRAVLTELSSGGARAR